MGVGVYLHTLAVLPGQRIKVWHILRSFADAAIFLHDYDYMVWTDGAIWKLLSEAEACER